MEARFCGHAHFDEVFLKWFHKHAVRLRDYNWFIKTEILRIFLQKLTGLSPASLSGDSLLRKVNLTFLKQIFPIFPNRPENMQPCNGAIESFWSLISYMWTHIWKWAIMGLY